MHQHYWRGQIPRQPWITAGERRTCLALGRSLCVGGSLPSTCNLWDIDSHREKGSMRCLIDVCCAHTWMTSGEQIYSWIKHKSFSSVWRIHRFKAFRLYGMVDDLHQHIHIWCWATDQADNNLDCVKMHLCRLAVSTTPRPRCFMVSCHEWNIDDIVSYHVCKFAAWWK